VDLTATALTLRLAAFTTLILFILGVPLAWWLATTRSRWRPFVDALASLPIVLPPTVLGFYLLVALAPNSPLGRGILAMTGTTLPFSFAGLLLGSVVCNLPFAVRPYVAGFASVERRHVEAAYCLGASRIAAFRRVALPLAWPGLISGCVLAFAHTLGEFGVVLMLGGNIPGVTRTLSISIYDDVQALDHARAGQTSVVLLGFSYAVLLVVHALERRRAR
jgi:molybdate transport system permease protein